MKQMDAEHLKGLFKIFNIGPKQVSLDLKLSVKTIEGLVHLSRPYKHYEGVLRAYLSAKRHERIKHHEAMIEYYKSVEI